jgi:hypothetical protein
MEFEIKEIKKLFIESEPPDNPVELARVRRQVGFNSENVTLYYQGCIDDVGIQISKIHCSNFLDTIYDSRYNPRDRTILNSVMILNGFTEAQNFESMLYFFVKPDVLCSYKSYYYFEEKQIVFLKVKYLISTFPEYFRVTNKDPALIYLFVKWICAVLDLWNHLYDIS